jgi:hypothetical protein
MALYSQETVAGEVINVFHCEHCDTLEAVTLDKAA